MNMKALFGTILVIVGILIGIAVGVGMLAWGIVDIVTEVKHVAEDTPMSVMPVVWGVLKIVFAGLVGWVSAVVLIIPGQMLRLSDLSTSRSGGRRYHRR